MMEYIKYYQDKNNGFLLAYEKSVEFFVMYHPQTKEWTDCNISFSNFVHDHEFKEITEQEVCVQTDGNLPKSMYRQYVEMIRKNSGCPNGNPL